MKFQISILTAGNKVLFETLDSIKANVKPPYKLFVWYHPLDEEHKTDLDFYNRILTYTDDVIMASKNQKCPAATGFMFIYKNYDYLLSINDDMVIHHNSVDTMLSIHQRLRRVGLVGEGSKSHAMKESYEISNVANLPDWGGMYNRETINEIGGSGAFFPTYGFEGAEFMMRMLMNNWRIFNYKGLFLHGGKDGKDHDTASKTKNFTDIQQRSFKQYHICERFGFRNYNWWSNKI